MSRKKAKSMSELLNAQLGAESMYADAVLGDEDLLSPDLEDLAEDDSDVEFDSLPVKIKGRRVEVSGSKASRKGASLRARGPLDAALSSGQYDAVPVSLRRGAESSVDDIFGLLDEDEGDAAVGDGIDDEEAYEAWLEENSKRRKRKRGGGATASTATLAGATDDDLDVLRQVEELRQRQIALVNAPADDDEAAATDRRHVAESMRNLLDTYANLLRVRVKLQPVVAKFVQLPQYYALPHFSKSEQQVGASVQGIQEALSRVYARMASLSLGAVDNSPFRKFGTVIKNLTSPAGDVVAAVKPQSKAGKKKTGTSTLGEMGAYAHLGALHKHILQNADAVIEHWAAKVVQARPAKAALKVVNQPLVDQIKSIVAAKARLLGKVQRNRNHVRIFGHPSHVRAATVGDRAAEIAEGDYDEEIFDDGEFVRELVHHSGAAAAKLEAAFKDDQAKLLSSLSQDAASLNKRGGGSKVGFHKKTKGKSVNYEPRPKLVGFMMRIAHNIADQHEAILASLFK